MKKSISKYKGSTVYNMHFYGITDLYDYITEYPISVYKEKRNNVLDQKELREALINDPRVNFRIFSSPASLLEEKSKSGDPLEDALSYLFSGYNKGFDNFLEISRNLKTTITEYNQNFEVTRSFYGGIPFAPLVAANVPDCMIRIESSYVETRNILFNLSYPHKMTKEQVRNRGLATLYIIDALESQGFVVNFKAFDLSKCKNEIIHTTIDLKSSDETRINLQKCYFLMVAEEALRRVLFRVIELSDVRDKEWGKTYGTSFKLQECRDYFQASSKDIIITNPKDLNITGENIYEDTLNMIETLNLDGDFNVQKLKMLSMKK